MRKKASTNHPTQDVQNPKPVNKVYERFNLLAQTVTDEIIKGLERGDIFWKQEWKNAAFPQNVFTKRPYNGFNALYLNFITRKHNYPTNSFITYQQAKQLGGQVRAGEKGYLVIFWKIRLCKVGEEVSTETGDSEERFQKKYTPFLWVVFNISQIDGIKSYPNTIPLVSSKEAIERCEQVVSNMPLLPQIQLGSPSYNQGNDTVYIPDLEVFDSSEAYYCTLFHELIHSTKHKS
jgi:antirestriction protein ArdC